MREEEVRRQLAAVYDPELDEPLTELGFIEGVAVEGGRVTVTFRLPTFWCAANFAFMMAADIRASVSALPWVEQVEVRLRDHAFDADISGGVNGGKSFREAFPGHAADDLDELRETFRCKAFLSRQERLVRWLVGAGWLEEEVLGLRVADLTAVAGEGSDGAALGGRYLAVLRERGLARDPGGPAMVRADGTPLDPAGLRSQMARAGRTRLSMEFNAAFCRGLLKTRYGEHDPVGKMEEPSREGRTPRRV